VAYTDKTRLRIETLSGIKTLELFISDGKVGQVRVEMGKTEVFDEKVFEIGGQKIVCIPVSVGNPHAVIFVENVQKEPVESVGSKIEKSVEFIGGVNVEFVQVISSALLRMRVWERGSGVTMACGTGACASVSAAVKKGYCPVNEWITVRLDGGDLQIKVCENGEVAMQGGATFVYEGETIE
jgi:diaminopimelate epimerase